jgi:hypothetical protein
VALSESERQQLTADINKILNAAAERLRQGLPDGLNVAVSMSEQQERGRIVRAIDRAIDRLRQQLPNLQVPPDLTELADRELLLPRIHRSVLFNKQFHSPAIEPFWPPSFDATEQSSAEHWEETEKAYTKHTKHLFEALRAYWEDRFQLFHAVTSDAPIADPKRRRGTVKGRYEQAALSFLGLDWNMIAKLYRLSDSREEFLKSINTITQDAGRILASAGLNRITLFPA